MSEVSYSNWEQVKQKFPGCHVYHDGSHYYIQRNYKDVPPRPDDCIGLGNILYESEDLMLLLRLYKPENISFLAQVIHTPNRSQRQYPYPQVFSELHSSPHYMLRVKECASFDTFFADAPAWPGWKSPWFKIARRYFLWGSSKEFHIGQAHIADWELERILDYHAALEAAIVPEHDFVARRLRERAIVLLQLSTDDSKALKKRFRELYSVRSTVAHGGVLKKSTAKILPNLMPTFEHDVRDLLKAALKLAPRDEKKERSVQRL